MAPAKRTLAATVALALLAAVLPACDNRANRAPGNAGSGSSTNGGGTGTAPGSGGGTGSGGSTTPR